MFGPWEVSVWDALNAVQATNSSISYLQAQEMRFFSIFCCNNVHDPQRMQVLIAVVLPNILFTRSVKFHFSSNWNTALTCASPVHEDNGEIPSNLVLLLLDTCTDNRIFPSTLNRVVNFHPYCAAVQFQTF